MNSNHRLVTVGGGGGCVLRTMKFVANSYPSRQLIHMGICAVLLWCIEIKAITTHDGEIKLHWGQKKCNIQSRNDTELFVLGPMHILVLPRIVLGLEG